MKGGAAQLRETGFVPKFGERGELRQKVGGTGRAHLDRWLPFLVLHRSADPAESLARRVAINSPAYLIWSPEDEGAALEALEAILSVVRARLGPVLLVSLADGPWEPVQEDSPRLPAFAVQIASTGGERAKTAADSLRESISGIQIELRRPDVEIADAVGEPMAADADEVRMTIPQIHRAPDGRSYPQITHELAAAFGDAVLRAASAFMATTPIGAPAHHRALGRSAFLAAALHADRKLDSIARSFDFLLSVSPINTLDAMQLFFEQGEDRPPEFRYRPLTSDPDVAKRELYAIDLSLLEDPVLEQLLCDKRRELDYQLTMLATRNSPGFRPASLLVYGTVDPALLDSARTILETVTAVPSRGGVLDAHQVAAAAAKKVEGYKATDESFDAKVEVRDDVSGLLVSGGRLMISSGIAVPESRLEALLAHEVSVHLLTWFNGAAQGLSIFRTGLAHYEGVQEGLGVFAEWAVGGLSSSRLRLLAGRVIAVDAMIDRADFIEVYRLLTRELGFSRRTAFDIAARVFRSGGFAKDAIYLKGFRHVLDAVAEGDALEPYWLGKIAPQHRQIVDELLLRGLLRPPLFIPEFFKREDTRRRIDRLRSGLPFDRVLELE